VILFSIIIPFSSYNNLLKFYRISYKNSMLLLKNISLKAEIIMFLNSLKIVFIFTKKIKKQIFS